jgi:hypothetical protein
MAVHLNITQMEKWILHLSSWQKQRLDHLQQQPMISDDKVKYFMNGYEQSLLQLT